MRQQVLQVSYRACCPARHAHGRGVLAGLTGGPLGCSPDRLARRRRVVAARSGGAVVPAIPASGSRGAAANRLATAAAVAAVAPAKAAGGQDRHRRQLVRFELKQSFMLSGGCATSEQTAAAGRAQARWLLTCCCRTRSPSRPRGGRHAARHHRRHQTHSRHRRRSRHHHRRHRSRRRHHRRQRPRAWACRSGCRRCGMRSSCCRSWGRASHLEGRHRGRDVGVKVSIDSVLPTAEHGNKSACRTAPAAPGLLLDQGC